MATWKKTKIYGGTYTLRELLAGHTAPDRHKMYIRIIFFIVSVFCRTGYVISRKSGLHYTNIFRIFDYIGIVFRKTANGKENQTASGYSHIVLTE